MKKVAIVGFNFMGTMHAQVYQRLPQAELVAVVVRDDARARNNLARLQLDLPVYPTITAVLEDRSVDVIDLCVPTDLHEPLFLEAAAASRHIFCEKPLALDLASAERMCRAAREAGIMVQVGHCLRFWPEYQPLLEMVQSGSSGGLRSLSLQRRAPRPAGEMQNWLNDEQRSGGAALDLHIHDTDLVSCLLGPPRAVTSTGARDEGGWSQIHTLYHYNDVTVTAEGGWMYPEHWEFQMAYLAVFENAVLEYDNRHTPSVRVSRQGSVTEAVSCLAPGGGNSSIPGLGNISSLGGYHSQLAYYLECLERGEPPQIATLGQARESLRITLAEIESARCQRTISLI